MARKATDKTTPVETPKETPQLYLVKRNIRYAHPTHPKGGQIVARGAKLPFDHLKQHQLKLLIRQGVLAKVEETTA